MKISCSETIALFKTAIKLNRRNLSARSGALPSTGRPKPGLSVSARFASALLILFSLFAISLPLPASAAAKKTAAAPKPALPFIVPTLSAGCSATSTDFPNNTATPIADNTVTTSTITVSGLNPYIWDIDLQTFITHTFPGDIDMTLTSPAGTVVTLTTDNAGTNDDSFNGTLWDDDANPGGQVPYTTNNGMVTDTVYTVGVPQLTLTPEEPLAAFQGEDPNGTWTLTISDDTAVDTGTLNSWNINITTFPTAPTTAVNSFPSTDTPVAIVDAGVVTSTINVSGLPNAITKSTLQTFITHTFPGDIDMTLTSPAGTVVTLTTDNAGTNDDSFNGTLWDDDANPGGQVPYTTNNGMVTDTVYTVGVPQATLTPEEPLGAFLGENPNGNWTLTISDDTAVDTGTLNNWTLNLTTGSCVTGDLSITKTDSPDPVSPGNNIAYSINVTNNGPTDSANVSVSDNIPTNTTFQSITAPAGWTCTAPNVNAAGNVTCTRALLANGASAAFTLVVNVNPGVGNGTVIANTAIVTAAGDPNTANNTAAATTTVAEFTSPAPTGLPAKALLVKPAAGNTTAGAGVSDSSCTAPAGVTVAGVFANINQALGAASSNGDTIYVCPKYTAGAVVPYIEHVSLGFTNLSVVGISDARGSRAVIAANPSTATTPTTQLGTSYIVQIAATGVNFGNFVIDGAPNGVNYANTGIFNGIAVRRSGAFVFNNTVQNIRTADAAVNANGQGIAVFGAGTAGSPLEAGTTASPVNVLNNIVQTYRSNGINVSAGSSSAYAFVRGNYVIGNGAAAGTVNQSGVQFQASANGDVFNNRISNIRNNNLTGCSAALFGNCSSGVRLNTTASSSTNNLRVRFNQINNTQTGIFAQDVQYVSMTSNNISHSAVDGINLRGSAFNLGSNFCTINQNTIFASRRAGVFIGLIGGDASLGNNLTQNTIDDAFTGVANNTPPGNNTIPTTGVTTNTFIDVNNFVSSASSGANDVQNTNPLP